MKYNKASLMKLENPNFPINESIIFDPNLIANVKGINDLKDVKVTGEGKYQKDLEMLKLDLAVDGVFNLNCAYTLEPFDYPFTTNFTLEFAFSNNETLDEDNIFAKGNVIDITPFVFEQIVCSIPIRAIKPNATIKRKGKGWELKEENEENDTDSIDPRLAKLKEFFK